MEVHEESKWEGISSLNNFGFEKEGIRAWRAFDIGEGRINVKHSSLIKRAGLRNKKSLHCIQD